MSRRILIKSKNAKTRSEVAVDTGNGHGSTNTKIRIFVNVRKNLGTAISYATSAANGDSFTINEAGIYSISYSDTASANSQIGISVNGSALTTNIFTVTYAQGKRAGATLSAGLGINVGVTLNLSAGDVVRAHTDGGTDGVSDTTMFTITKVAG